MHRISIVVLFLLLCVANANSQTKHSVEKLTDEQAKSYELDPSFYKKATVVQDILIATSEKVSDHAHLEAAYQFEMIMGEIDQEVAQRIREKKVLCILIGHKELTSELPQFQSTKTGKELDFYNWRNRGFLTHKFGRPTVVFAEEDVLEFEGGMQIESILIHEFGHVIDGAGFDKKQKAQLKDAFERALAKGIWMDGRAAQRFRRVKSKTPVSLLDELVKAFPNQSPNLIRKALDGGDILVNGERSHYRAQVTKRDRILIQFGGPKECYAHKNKAEYWAEGVQCWYNTNRTMDHDHNHIHTRAQLKEYDPALAELCKDVLGDHEWRFVSPRKRAGKGHLSGFDPSKSPKVVDPPHIETAALDYYDNYWKDYWKRLVDKHSLAKKLKSESIESLAKSAEQKGDAIRGAVLFTKKSNNCVACHQAGNNKMLGPDLTQLEKETTTAHLVESILYPSKKIREGYETVLIDTLDGKSLSGRIVSKNDVNITLRDVQDPEKTFSIKTADVDEMSTQSVSSMPDGLVDEMYDRQEFLDVVRYLTELVRSERSENPGVTIAAGKSVSDDLMGAALIDKFNCRACHALQLDSFMPIRSSFDRGPKLEWLAGHVDHNYIFNFLSEPAKAKPHSAMPDLLAGETAENRQLKSFALTHYVLSLAQENTGRSTDSKRAIQEMGMSYSTQSDVSLATRLATSQELSNRLPKFQLRRLEISHRNSI